MNDRGMQAVWAATDKQTIDRMKPRTLRLAANFDNLHFTSSEESSESDLESEASFLAVPREFRPNFSPKKSPAVKMKTARNSPALTQGPQQRMALPISTKSQNDPTHTNSNSPQFAEAICTRQSLPFKANMFKEGNRRSNQVDTAEIKVKPKQNVAIEVVIPRKHGDCLKITDTSGASMTYPKNTQANSLPPRYNFTVPGKKHIPQGIEFEYVNVSERIQITRTQTIEIDIAKLNSDKRSNKITKDTPTFKKPPEIKKTTPCHMKNKNPKRYYQSNKRDHSSTKQFPNLSKGDTVKWNSLIGLNKSEQAFPNNSLPEKERAAENFKKVSKKKVEWTIQEENVPFSHPRVSNNNLIHKEKMYNFTDKNETKDFNFDYRLSSGIPQQNKDKLYSMQLNYKTHDTQSYFVSAREETGWEEDGCSEFYSFKNDLTKNLGTNENNEVYQQSYQEKQDGYNQKGTALPINTYKQITDIFKEKSRFNNNDVEICGSTWDLTVKNNYSGIKLSNDEKMKKDTKFEEENSLMYFGKEISDLVIGSHMALSALFIIYDEWKQLRLELIGQFQQLEKTMQESTNKYERYQDLLKVGNGVATFASNVPHPYVAIAAKIVSAITSLISMFVTTSGNTDSNMDDSELTRLVLQDKENSAELYMHGLQCNMQFKETTKIIEEFYLAAMNYEFNGMDIECSDILTFVKGVKEYTPKHCIFYKKLHKCYQELLQKASSQYSRRFCEPFLLDKSNAVDVIGYLKWRFIEVDNATVEAELKEIQHMIQSNSSSICMKVLVSKIKNCVRILNNELESVQKCVAEIPLFNK